MNQAQHLLRALLDRRSASEKKALRELIKQMRKDRGEKDEPVHGGGG